MFWIERLALGATVLPALALAGESHERLCVLGEARDDAARDTEDTDSVSDVRHRGRVLHGPQNSSARAAVFFSVSVVPSGPQRIPKNLTVRVSAWALRQPSVTLCLRHSMNSAMVLRLCSTNVGDV